MLIYIIICETECQDIFQKNYGKMTKKYQMMWMQEKRIHIYGKKGNNENENTEKCGFHGDDRSESKWERKEFTILQKKRMRV